MKAEDLLKGLNDLEDEWILEARTSGKKAGSGKRRLITLIAAALTISMLGITVLAAGEGSGWLRDFFTRRSDFALSDSQQQYIEQNSIDVQASQTNDGYTLTLDTAISDGVNTYIRFLLTAPEGTVLDAESYAFREYTHMVNENGEPFTGDIAIGTLDQEPGDNVVSILLIRSHSWDEDHYDSIFRHTWTLRVSGLYAQDSSYSEEAGFDISEKTLSDACWEFSFTFPEQGNEEIAFITEPVNCPCKVNLGAQGYHEEDVAITSLVIRALSARLTFQHPKEDLLNGDFGHIFAVMKDGSMARLIPESGAPNKLTYKFSAPIVVSDIDYILLPNDARLYPPQG